MKTVWQFLTDRRTRRFAAGLGVVLACLLVAAWYSGLVPADLMTGWRRLEQLLLAHPLLLALALVILPGLPVPTSALLVTAGVVWREHPVLACGTAVCALALNAVWTYAFAAGPGRRLVERMLARSSVRIPVLPRNDHLRLILILRLTPGIPFFFQNYVLGLLRPPFRLYLPVSLACNAPIVCGLVLSGAGLAGGRLMPLLVGISLVVLAAVIAQSARRWLKRRNHKVESAEPG
jgi:uncharacterized membrane protein YdjX (TVP38/TMEM64 family)